MNARCPTPTIDEELCTLCGLCVEACPCGAIVLGEHGPVFTAPGMKEHCVCAAEQGADCAQICEEVCPTGAIVCEFIIVTEAAQGVSGSEDSSADTIGDA